MQPQSFPAPPATLPALRQDLTLNPAPAAPDGSPCWTLHDPAANRFYQLGWAAFEILSRWSLGTAEAVVDAVNAQTTVAVDAEDVAGLARFLAGHHLTLEADAQGTARLAAAAARHKPGVAMWLLKNYLFLRVPLVRPMPFLRRAYPWIAFVYRRGFWWLTAAALLFGLYLVSRQWDAFLHTFRAYTTWQGLLGLALALSFAKVLHELGHAFTAYRHGCRVPTMGFALLVLWPVLFTDTNEAWKLKSRHARLQIGVAGVLAELALAAWATLLWSFLPDGPLRAGVFMLATSTWIVTLLINASPFTRFDGYYLLGDWLNVPNLHERTFALGRWWLRERLFGFGDPPPEALPRRLHRFLLGFAWITWLYRFVLFLSIALLVFHVFFRALGIVLMCVELGWFIALPIARELAAWWQRRGDLRWNRQTARTALVGAALMLVLLVPWQATVRAPAVLGQARTQAVYTPRAAQVVQVAASEGQRVHAGAAVVRLASPELDYQLASARHEAAQLDWQVRQQPFDDELLALGPALGKRLETARQAVAGLEAERARLALRAPLAGRIVDVALALRAGEWLPGGAPLFRVVGNGGIDGSAFVDEAARDRLAPGQPAEFVAALLEQPAVRCRVAAIDRLNLADLDDDPYLASVYGGSIPALRQPDGTLVPLESTFRVRLDHCDGGALPRELPGSVAIRGESRSLLARAARWLRALLRSETGI
jgi:putative peptide zinc metalloprotease protein